MVTEFPEITAKNGFSLAASVLRGKTNLPWTQSDLSGWGWHRCDDRPSNRRHLRIFVKLNDTSLSAHSELFP
jgi:hypothetical protein